MKHPIAIVSATALGAAILVSGFIVRAPAASPVAAHEDNARQVWCDAHDVSPNPITCFLEYDKRNVVVVHVVPALKDSPTYSTSLDVRASFGHVLLVNPPADAIIESTAVAPNSVNSSWFQFKTFVKK